MLIKKYLVEAIADRRTQAEGNTYKTVKKKKFKHFEKARAWAREMVESGSRGANYTVIYKRGRFQVYREKFYVQGIRRFKSKTGAPDEIIEVPKKRLEDVFS